MNPLSRLLGKILGRGPENEKAFHNPVNGKTYVADWGTQSPEKPRREPAGPVRNAGVRLLSTQEEFSKNVSVEELSGFIQSIEDALRSVAGRNPGAGEIRVQVELSPAKRQEIRIAYQGDLPEQFLQEFHDTLGRLPAYHSGISNVSFQVHFIVGS